ncbi:MAG: transketolase family protein [Deltaproteobacteria bacterium]|nr:transketolase family protein [Deltaproteobacteria bacterium]
MSEKIATRDAYGRALVELGKKRQDVVVLDADLSCSTKTIHFAKAYPERFFNMGVAEQDMMGTAAGFALAGKTVFASSFAMFATGRAFEIVRNSIAYPKLNVKICASHAGLTVGEDGASHQTVEDIAIMRAIPNMSVIVPADGVETAKVIESIADYPGPVYVRLSRAASPILFPQDHLFQLGRSQVLREGKALAIVACGLMLSYAMEAAELLKQQGIEVSVLNMASIKPLDEKTLKEVADYCGGKVMTVEEHSIMGGLGSAVAEVLAEYGAYQVHRVGVRDEFGQSGKASDLLEHYQLTPHHLVKQAQSLI